MTKTSAATKCSPPALLAQQLERLRAAGIRLLPLGETPTHVLCERNGFAALVVRREQSLGPAGSPGLRTENGLAVLVWKQGQAFFVTKDRQQPATEEQVRSLREFAADLDRALGEK
jgi:hypothetical protein